MEIINEIAQIGTLIAALGVLATVWGIRASVHETRKALAVGVFTTFTNRYSEIMNGLPDELHGKLFNVTKEKVVGQETTVHKVLAQYLDLCAEELYLHDHDLLPRGVWEIWVAEMIECLRSDVVREYWAQNSTAFASNRRFATFVDGCL
jgi:hypothetical protein